MKYEDISALEAKNRAQEIAFGPMLFQAVIALRRLGALELISKNKKGISTARIAELLSVSKYGIETLLEMAECGGVVRYLDENTVALTNTGFFLNSDKMTEVNLDFVNDVCYLGAMKTLESVQTGKPEGLKVFGPWPTVYEGLSQLPEKIKKSWFAFDHYYSDDAFPAALEILFGENRPSLIFDIGGNTGKWAIACCKHNSTVKIKILDLPGQVAVAKKNIQEQGFADRVSFLEVNMLKPETVVPAGADIIWMSQFLDCFSEEEIISILKKAAAASGPSTRICILEPFTDNQEFQAARYCLTGTSLYFTTIANGNSKMYRLGRMKDLIKQAGLEVKQCHPLIGYSFHTMIECGLPV